jgi:hypothetical protein
MQSLVELICGRAILYDDSGLADAYQLDAQSNQHAPQSLFDGLIFSFVPANSNTGASTLNFVGLGVKALLNSSGEPLVLGDILSGERISVTYSASGDEFLLLPQLNTATESRLLSGRRNVLLNGDKIIWQEGISFTVSNKFTCDMWKANVEGAATNTVTRQSFALGQTDVPFNPKYYSRSTVVGGASASDLSNYSQPIEGVDTLAGETATLSFWAKADANKTLAVDFLQDFGTGGSPSASVSSNPTTFNLTNAWQRFQVTVTLPSISGKVLGTNNNDTLRTVFWHSAGSDFDARTNSLGLQSGTFDLWGIQLERGSIATDFETHREGEELARCQYYFCTSYPKGVYPGDTSVNNQPEMIVQSDSTARLVGYVGFPVAMRAKPTLNIYRPSNGVLTGIEKWDETNIKAVNSAEVSRYGINSMSMNSTGTAGEPYQFHFTADARIY